ncbi:DNA cytosine-5-methyltransferase 1-like protein isoform X2 [Cinnamomum micranthum f. kanehirae]|uniref:DNA cytosine-5-methyltransferase 1-like protein isoform X2 n=1 Tax=Cinnamomum micranthum f. kanehirae TaxID=337451 RepID=A0A443N3R6_9MAGN|nr:DNA cytosine-5-methyltransferase 1-like protein isoform X2 [Cinnamomum micranthum f. kanehirae]
MHSLVSCKLKHVTAGHVKNATINISIDSGTTHNFVTEAATRQTGQAIYRSNGFNVLVADGNALRGSFLWRKISCRNHLKSRRHRQGRSPVALALSESVFRQRMSVKDCWRDENKEGGKNESSAGKCDEEKKILQARCHYSQAQVDDVLYNLNDAAYIKGEGKPDYIGKIVEFFKATNNKFYSTPQWLFKAEDTVIKDQSNLHDTRRVFLSNLKDVNLLDRIISKISILRVSPNVCLAQWFFKAKDTVVKDQSNLHDTRCVFLSNIRDVNLLDCISKISIVRVSPNVDLETKERTIPRCDFQYNSSYSPNYSTSANLPTDLRSQLSVLIYQMSSNRSRSSQTLMVLQVICTKTFIFADLEKKESWIANSKFYFTAQWFSKQKILLSKINLTFMIQDVFSYQISRMSTYLTVSSLRLLVYEFLQMYVRHNGFSKQKILLSKINLIFMIQDLFSYQIPRMSTYLTVSSVRLVMYEFSPNVDLDTKEKTIPR